MALEFCFVPGDADQSFEVDNELLESPEGLLIENYAYGEREIIGIESKGPDGGQILFFSPSEILQEMEIVDMPVNLDLDELPEPTGIIRLGAGQTRDIEFMDGEGAQGFLRVRHVADTAITSTLLVPEGLYFPDRKYPAL